MPCKVTPIPNAPSRGNIHCDCEHGACELNEVHIPGGCHAYADGKYSIDGFQNMWLCEYCRHVYEVEQ